MTWRSRWLWVPPACLAVMALSCGAAAAADKTKVDRATKQVEQGAQADRAGQGRAGLQGDVHWHRPHDRRGRQVQRQHDGGVLQEDFQ